MLKEATLSHGHVSIRQPALLLGRSGGVLTFLWESCVVLVGSDFPPYDHVFFKWKQLKKGWEKLELQLPFLCSAGCSLTLFRQHGEGSQPPRRGERCGCGPTELGFWRSHPRESPKLRHTYGERSGVPDGILINNNTQLLLRWDKPCCKSPPFPRLSVAFEDLFLLLLLFISIQSQD